MNSINNIQLTVHRVYSTVRNIVRLFNLDTIAAGIFYALPQQHPTLKMVSVPDSKIVRHSYLR